MNRFDTVSFCFPGTLDSILVSDDVHWNTCICMFDKTNSLLIWYFCCTSVETIQDKMLLRCLRKFGGIMKPWTKSP